jgi:Mg2+ and Co2+ transporter CorA
MEAKVKLETGHNSLSKEKLTLSNLLYYQELVDTHLSYLRATVEVIKHQGGLRWPHVPEQNRRQHGKAKTAAESLLRDFEHLVQRAESLLSRCVKGMNVIMNDVNLAESKRAISQAQGVAKLTLIAFFYIPLSFTTSFFGMNFAELGNGTLSLWIWFAASIPIFIISVSFLLFDFRKLVTIGKKVAKWFRSIF